MKTLRFFVFLLAFAMGITAMEMRADKSVEMPDFIITDNEGNSTKVTNLKILITGGSRTYYSTSFDVLKGDATLTLKLNELAGCINNWTTKNVILFFQGGKTLKVKLLSNSSEAHYMIGTALVANMKVPFKLRREKMKSMFIEGFKLPAKYKNINE